MDRLHELHYRVLQGNQAAFDFITQLFEVLHLWDDLIDKDKAVTPEVVNDCFWKALVDIPENRFYQAHFVSILPILKMAILNWHAANAMELTKEESDKHIAFILRSTYVDMVTHCAGLIGGRDWAIKVAEEVRRETSGEGFENYIKATATEKRVIDHRIQEAA
jgi:hypothetical protein